MNWPTLDLPTPVRSALRVLACGAWFATAFLAYHAQLLHALLALSMAAASSILGRTRPPGSGRFRLDFLRELRAGRAPTRDCIHVGVRCATWLSVPAFVALNVVQAPLGMLLWGSVIAAVAWVALQCVFFELRPAHVGHALSVTLSMALVLGGVIFESGRFLIGERGPAVELAAPWSGTWAVVQGGLGKSFNGHYPVPSQRNAVDVVATEDGRDGRARKELSDFYCWDRPLLAPAAGKVVRVVDGRPDWPIGQRDPENPVGNHVVLEIGPERYVLLAHLKQGSVAVREGQAVRTGELLGRCGNSGNTSQPHLHLQVQTRLDPLDRETRTLPMRIRSAGEPAPARAPRRNDEIIGAPAPG